MQAVPLADSDGISLSENQKLEFWSRGNAMFIVELSRTRYRTLKSVISTKIQLNVSDKKFIRTIK